MKVLKFGAVWCVECLVMKPMWAEIEKKFSGLDTEYFDADDDAEKLKSWGVEEIPCFIFLDKDGQEWKRLKGVQNRENLEEIVRENLNR